MVEGDIRVSGEEENMVTNHNMEDNGKERDGGGRVQKRGA